LIIDGKNLEDEAHIGEYGLKAGGVLRLAVSL